MRFPSVESRGIHPLSAATTAPLFLAVGAVCFPLAACGEAPPELEEATASGPPVRAEHEDLGAPEIAILRPFEARFELPLAGHKLTGALAVDVDGDGVDEFALVSLVPGGLFYWDDLRGGLDAEHPPRKIALDGYGIGPAPFDPSRPGLVAAASQESRTVHLFDLARDPGAERLWTHELAETPTALAAGRIEGRDAPVLAVITETEELHLIDEQGDVTAHPLSARRGDHPTCLHFLESGAGLLVGLQGEESVELYAPDGNGDLRTEPAYVVPLGGIPRDVCEADLDGDGDRELVVVGGDQSIWVLGWGTSGGPLAGLAAARDGIVEWRAGAIPIAVETADFDEDGALELCVLDYHDSALHVLDDFAEPQPASRVVMEGGQTPWGLALGDFDGDGHADVVTTNRDAYRASLILGNGDGSFVLVHRVGCGRAPRGVATCDLDGDGYPDALALSAIDQGIAVLRSEKGLLREGEPVDAPPATDGLLGVDLDGDGHQDAAYLAATARGGELVVLFGDGRGALALRQGFEPIVFGVGVGDLWCSDLDGDGANDVVVSDPEGGRVLVFAGQRAATGFALGAPRAHDVPGGPAALNLLPAEEGRPPRLCVGMEGARQEQGVVFLEVRAGGGGGIQLVPAGSLPCSRRAGAVSCADFNGDRRCDVAVLGLGSGDVSTGEIFVWLAKGSGEFELGATLKTSLAPYMIVAADLNGDGRADLAGNAQHSHHVSVWLSRGEGPSPFLRLADLGAGRGPLDLCATDMDLDGRIDLVIADHYSSSVSTLFNRLVSEVNR